MGNSQGKEAQPPPRGHARRASAQTPSSPTMAGPSVASHERSGSAVYRSRTDRGSTSFLGIGGSTEPRDPALEPRRETKAEREARKLEKERALRLQERERSLREEGVDGGFLVTLGVYTGPEDYSKPMVRQLQVCVFRADFTSNLTRPRSSDDLRRSGRVSTIMKTPGRSTSS